MFQRIKTIFTPRAQKALALFMVFAFLLTSCRDKEAEALEVYRDHMSVFFDNVTNLSNSLNAIDKDAKDATQTLLSLLDSLGREFETLRGFEIPEDFSSISDITIDAADSMKKSVELFHRAYDGDYDAAAEADAYSYYERASRCIRVIMQVLNGEAPSVEGVTYQ